MGRPAKPLPERITAAIAHAGRPLTRTELIGWYLTTCTRRQVDDQVEAMLIAGTLVDVGPEPASNRAIGDWTEHERRLYGLKAGAPGRR